jgi:hypothetical protein
MPTATGNSMPANAAMKRITTFQALLGDGFIARHYLVSGGVATAGAKIEHSR